MTEPVLQRAFEYWRNVDTNLGGKVEAGLRAGQGEKDPKAAEQANPAASTCRPRPDHQPTPGAGARRPPRYPGRMAAHPVCARGRR